MLKISEFSKLSHLTIKALRFYKYLHQYKAADEKAKKLAEDVIEEEDNLAIHLRAYL